MRGISRVNLPGEKTKTKAKKRRKKHKKREKKSTCEQEAVEGSYAKKRVNKWGGEWGNGAAPAVRRPRISPDSRSGVRGFPVVG